jgi:flagellar protein FlaG
MSITISNNMSANSVAAVSQIGPQRLDRSTAPPPESPPQRPEPAQVARAVETIKQLVEAKAPNSLSFSIDDSTGRSIVRITDQTTGEMVRQIPSEEMLEIARSIDKLQGMLIKQQA